MGAKLIVVSGKSAGKAIGLKHGKLLIGRADECDVRPLGEEVSRRHCLLEVAAEALCVKDLGSRNGTFVNGVRIQDLVQLRDGDIVRVGPLELRVSSDRPAARPTVDGDDVSRWLMADDDDPAGISDTTRTLRVVGANDDVPGSEEPGEGTGAARGKAAADAPAAAGAAAGNEAADKSANAVTSAIESLLASKSKPGGLPAAAKADKSESSREAAAEALKKFFGKK